MERRKSGGEPGPTFRDLENLTLISVLFETACICTFDTLRNPIGNLGQGGFGIAGHALPDWEASVHETFEKGDLRKGHLNGYTSASSGHLLRCYCLPLGSFNNLCPML